MAKIKIKDLSNEIASQLQTYTREVTESMDEIKKDVGNESVKMLKQRSPQKTGKYAKGWRLKRTNTGYVIHNATRYMLTHLLEKGHPKRNGGRVAGKPHIGPVEVWAVDEYIKRTEKVIRG